MVVLDLRKNTTVIAATVKCLEDRLGSLDATTISMTVSCFEERLDAFQSELDAYTREPVCMHAAGPSRNAPRDASPSCVHVNPTTNDPYVDTLTNPVPTAGNPRFPNVDPSTFPQAGIVDVDDPTPPTNNVSRDRFTHTKPSLHSSTSWYARDRPNVDHAVT